MNPQIEKLRLQAWYYADDNSHDGDGKHGRLYAKKFAELIVKECIEEVMNYHAHNNPTREMVPFIVEDIKLHFGVNDERTN